MVANFSVESTDRVELFVSKLVPGGMGIAEFRGFKVFVPYVVPGERIKARIVTEKKDYAIAQIEKILEPSPYRVSPRCPYYGICGGCQLQHIAYEEQLVIKKMLVNDALQRIGKIFVPVDNINFKSPEWHYRNKTQFPVGGDKGTWRIGFYKQKTHQLIDIPTCFLHPENFNKLRVRILNMLSESEELPYNEEYNRGNIRYLIIRQGINGEIMLIFVTKSDHLNVPRLDILRSEFPSIIGIVQNINPEKTNRIMGEINTTISGRGFLEMQILGRKFRVSAGSFFQINTAQTEELCRKVIDVIAPQGDEVVLDLFSGVGTISLTLADKVRKVIGIEIDAGAVADAQFNVNNLGIKNANFICADVNSAINTIGNVDVVILDPPRKGCLPDTLYQITNLSPRIIIYVSCNPATLARDVALLERLGYLCKKVEPLDMFPQTAHIEVIATLNRK